MVVVGVKLSRRLIGRMSVVLKLVGVAPCRDLLEGSGGLLSRPWRTAAVIKGTMFSTTPDGLLTQTHSHIYPDNPDPSSPISSPARQSDMEE